MPSFLVVRVRSRLTPNTNPTPINVAMIPIVEKIPIPDGDSANCWADLAKESSEADRMAASVLLAEGVAVHVE